MRGRKLQIFLSSTYTDMVDLRLAAIEAVLAAGHIPATMEQFAPGDETALAVIRQWIKDSDAVLVMLGGRYGSLEPESSKSYVHLEYEWASEQGKPLAALVMSDRLLQERITSLGFQVADERQHPDKYSAFKKAVTSKLCSFFDDKKDIRSIVLQKVPQWAQRDDLLGWVRADEAISPRVTEELARLSAENAELKKSGDLFDGVSFDDFVEILRRRPVVTRGPDDSVRHAGHLFSECMDLLAVNIDVELGGRQTQGAIAELDLLVTEGLAQRDLANGDVFRYTLTPMGRRFRNRLLTLHHRSMPTAPPAQDTAAPRD